MTLLRPAPNTRTYRDDPRRFVRELTDFVESTEPSDAADERLRELLREGA